MIWGGLNGVYQVIGEILMPVRDWLTKRLELNCYSIGHKLVHIVGTFVLIDFAWIFFRANNLSHAIMVVINMRLLNNAVIFWNGEIYECGLDSKNFGLMVLGIGILLVVDILKRKGTSIRNTVHEQDPWCKSIVIAFAVCFILLFGIWGPSYSEANFIYFQF